MKSGTCTALVDCNNAPVADVLVEDLAVSLCPAHLFEHLAEEAGWEFVAVSTDRPLREHAAELVTDLRARDEHAWRRAVGYLNGAVAACETGDIATASAALRAVRLVVTATP